VLDLSRFIAGPYIGRMLSDLGADVVKVEPPGGDVTRAFGVLRDGLAGLYVQENAGKRNVCLDLKAAGAREVALALAERADLVIENFRPGVLARLGLGWETLSARNPRLILISISGFGQSGPEAQRQAYAPIIHAESGWLGRKLELLGEAPKDSCLSFADSISGLHGAVAVLSALYLRERTGRGQHIDLAMLDAWHATDDYIHYLLDGAEPVLQGGEIYDAPGGLLMLNRTLPHVWKLLKSAVGITSEEPEGADTPTKAKYRREAVLRWMASFPTRDALKHAIEDAGLAWGEVRGSATQLASPTVAAREMAVPVTDDRGHARLVVQMPYRFSDASAGVRGAAPRIGQHNREVLAEWLGLGDAAIRVLHDGKVLSEGDEA
jgi:CoA:oxalate CoA-transferase